MDSHLVECRSGHTYAQRPLAFWWQEERLEVEAVESEWRTPMGKAFRVRCTNRKHFELEYNEQEDNWQIKVIL
jgi:hypothetical protein